MPSMLRVVFAVVAVPLIAGAAQAATPSPKAYVRVNQVGFATGAPRRALLMAKRAEPGVTFRIVDVATATTVHVGTPGARLPKWSGGWKYVYPLDLSALTTPGRYRIEVDGPWPATSPSFTIGTGIALYGPLLSNARRWFLLQHDGDSVDAGVLGRQPSHLADHNALVYATPTGAPLSPIGGPLDVAGGWFDAGDYLKFVETASYTTAAMLFAMREYPAPLSTPPADFVTEARFGLDWLLRAWDDASGTLYYQVGLGDTYDSFLADHDGWRLPEADDLLSDVPADPTYFVKHRPAFRAGPAGSLVSPNLAGRLAAAFALGFQVYRTTDPTFAAQCLRAAEHVFDLADPAPVGELLTAYPFDFYPETEWRDDLAWGAAELSHAVSAGGLPGGLPHTNPAYYLDQAANWMRAYLDGPGHFTDTLNLYDVSGLAQAATYRAFAASGFPTGLAVTGPEVLADLGAQLSAAQSPAASDPFDLGFPYADGDVTPHALGIAVMAALYDDLSVTNTYRAFGQHQLDFVFGGNAWGESFVVGAGTTFPRCLHHQIANLSGALDGSAPLALGATVDGPNTKRAFRGIGTPDGANACPAVFVNTWKKLDARGVKFEDRVKAHPSVEPTNDYVVLGLYLFAREITLAP